MRKAILGPVLAAVLGACGLAPAATTPSVAPSDPPSPSAGPTAAVSPDPRVALIDAAQARWATRHPSSYAFTYTHLGSPGGGWYAHYRVTSLDGRVAAQSLDGLTLSQDDLATIGVDGLFESLRRGLGLNGETRMRFDPTLGYPTEIAYATAGVSDGSSTETVTDFVSMTDDGTAAHVRDVLRSARTAWQRWEPIAYEYVWRRFEAAPGPSSGTAWRVQHVGGRTSTEADPVSDGALRADAASVPSTFDAMEAALDAAAWVDLTVDSPSGMPLLAAIDPSSAATGDESWIRITYRDIEAEVAATDLEAARARWSAADLQHFSYTWRYRGDLDPLTYGVTCDGDRSLLRRAAGTPIPEARANATPRIDDTFQLIEEVLSQGGRVIAMYDPVLGYPVRVDVEPAGDVGARGTITIKDFAVR